MATQNTNTKSKQVYSFPHASRIDFVNAHSTPSFIPSQVKHPVEAPKPAPMRPLNTPPAGTNASTKAMEAVLKNTNRKQKIYGLGVGY